ncbi:MAG: universal stress protein, partial [Blastocatellia bacterium]
MKVLLTTDGSTQSTTALQTAIALLQKERARFTLLCVAPDFTPPKAKLEGDAKKRAQMIESYRELVRVQAREMLARVQASLAENGVEAGIRTETGSPARVIVGLANDYDLTVVGAHDRYTRSKAGLGPVASRVVALAPNAVLVGRELPADRNWRVLAAVDGSRASARALSLMAACFSVHAAEITLMSVTETPWVHLGLGREWFDYPREMIDRTSNEVGVAFENELKYEAENVVEAGRRRLERHGLSANTLITEGDPALEIAGEAERGEYDLIVMGATGESDLKHDMLGSVSTKVAQDATCSVLIAKISV